MIIFKNQGEIDPMSIKTFGVSMKETENPIGYFGTGLKYSIPILLRDGCGVKIYSGETVYEFDVKKQKIRGVDFCAITMNGEGLPFTTELGKNWEMWQAFREIYCNIIDEKGSVKKSILLPLATKGYAYIVVKGQELKEAVLLHDKADEFLSEHIIDDCGYDLEKEHIGELKGLVVFTSAENQKLLNYVRARVPPIKQRHVEL